MRPLSGVRVLDFSRILAGPFCSMLLGDMGADVIKIERPDGGDDTRSWGPPFCGSESTYFISVNRNKKSVCIDLKSPAGLNAVYKLVEKSDVVIENFIPDKMHELGLAYSHLSAINPKIVYCSISGFGSTGPYAHRPGYDIVASAMYGMFGITGQEGSSVPVKPGVAVTDVITGLFAHGAIISALYERNNSGRGQMLETSLMEGQLASLVNIASAHLAGGVSEFPKWGTAHPSIVPYQAFQCSCGGSIIVAVGSDKQFEEMCQTIGMNLSEAETMKYKHNDGRVRNRKELVDRIQCLMMRKTRLEWNDIFQEKSVSFPNGPVRTIPEAFSDPQAIARDMVMTVQHPKVGEVKLVGPAVKYSRTPCGIDLAPPLLGQHTRQVLTELAGLSDSDVRLS